MVIAGRQPSSSLRMLRQTVPDGYTFGWKSGGVNLPAAVSVTLVTMQLVVSYTLVASLGTLSSMSARFLNAVHVS